jgi:cell division protein FtsB
VSERFGDQRNRPAEGIWYSLSKFIVLLTVVTAAVPVAFSFMPEVNNRKEQLAKLEELRAAVEHETMLNARYEREENLLKHDPDFAAVYARDRLDLMKDGEMIFRLDSPR